MGMSTKTFSVLISAVMLIVFASIGYFFYAEYAFEYYVAFVVTMIYLEVVKKPDMTD